MIVYSLTIVDHRLQIQETNKCHSSIVVNKFSEVPENRIVLVWSIVCIHDDPFSCRIREISAKTHINSCISLSVCIFLLLRIVPRYRMLFCFNRVVHDFPEKNERDGIYIRYFILLRPNVHEFTVASPLCL